MSLLSSCAKLLCFPSFYVPWFDHQEFQGELQLKGEFRTGFAIYDGQPGADEDGRNHGIRAPTRFEYTEGDLPRFKGLWKWGQARIGHKPTIKANYRSTLGQILHQYERDGAINNNGASTTNEASSKSSDKDYTVMISSMIPFPGDQRTGATPMGFLRVWDGTGPSTADRMPVRVPRTVRDLTTEALSKISEIKEHRGGRPQFDPPQRFHGRVVNVVIWEKEHWEYLCHQNGIVGTFIRLRNARERFFDEIGIRCKCYAKELLGRKNACF